MDWMKLFRASLPFAITGILVFMVALGITLTGGGGDGDEEDDKPGPGTAVGLEEAGMQRCAGPVPHDFGADVSVYADAQIAVVLASGSGVIEFVVDRVQVRHGDAPAPTKRKLKRTERSWRRYALTALRGANPDVAPCRKVERHPVLGPAEVVCANEVVLPLGLPHTRGHFENVLASLGTKDGVARDICPEL